MNINKQKLLDATREMRRIHLEAIAMEIEGSTETFAEIAELLGTSELTVIEIASQRDLRRTSEEMEPSHAS